MRFDVGDAHGTKVVIATRSRPDGRLAWAGIRVAAPAVVQFWKVVAGALVLVFALLLVAAVDALRRVRAASTTLTSSARALVSDLRAPIPEPEVHELAGVAGALRSLASGLDSARHSHEELTAALAQERQLAALGRVAAAIAHEVRNPLAAIKLRVDLVCEGTGSAAERQVDLEVLAREVDRLSRLVTNLLAHTRASAAEPTSRDLAALARERAAMLVPLARQRDVAIEVGGSGSAPVDLDAATRALDNLLRNALDAAPTNTRIEIDVRTREGATEIAVSDHGSGIPADRMAELFEPFFTTKPGGTGLGLSLARAIVRAHAGELTHHRSAHRTTFTMSFPHEHD
jgi:signal transduction histidine kinase